MLDWWWWQADYSWWHHTYGLIIPSRGEIWNVPSDNVLPNVNIPLSTIPIVRLLSLCKIALKHNFISSVLVIAGGMMALNYKTLTKVYTGCPIVVCRRLERPLQSRLPCLWLARHWYYNKADDLLQILHVMYAIVVLLTGSHSSAYSDMPWMVIEGIRCMCPCGRILWCSLRCEVLYCNHSWQCWKWSLIQ